ncbi:hypothetical protein [Streptomyces nodosus]|nr:hypothetical protein [Streptomyces nodosus]MBB4789591.1 hypothetical protein [Streptomyces nodosus]
MLANRFLSADDPPGEENSCATAADKPRLHDTGSRVPAGNPA